MTNKTILSTAIAGTLMLGSLQPAHALGKDGETALQILGGIYVIEKIVDHTNKRNRRYERPLSSDEQRAYEEGVLARERQEAAERRRRAYECGYTGNC